MRKNIFLTMALLVSLCQGVLWAQSEVQTLTLNDMFALAEQNNRRLIALGAGLEEAAEEVRIAEGAMLPSAQGSLRVGYNGNGYVMDRNFTNGMVAEIPSFANNFSLEVSQVIYAGGAIQGAIGLAERKERLARLGLESETQNVRFEIVGYVLDMAKLKNQIEVIVQTEEQTGKVLENMRVRVESGVALRNDITRYELQLQNLAYTRLQLENGYKLLKNRLASTIGIEAESFEVALGELGEVVRLSTDECVARALENSLILQMSDTAVEMSRIGEKMARSEMLPKVAIYAGEYMDGPVVIEIPALNKNFNYWGVGVAIQYNFDSLWKGRSKVRAAKYATERAESERREAAEQIVLSVEEAIAHYHEALELYSIKQKSVALATDNYDLVSYRYDNDMALLTDLLDASLQQMNSRIEAVNAQINIAYNYYKICYLAASL